MFNYMYEPFDFEGSVGCHLIIYLFHIHRHIIYTYYICLYFPATVSHATHSSIRSWLCPAYSKCVHQCMPIVLAYQIHEARCLPIRFGNTAQTPLLKPIRFSNLLVIVIVTVYKMWDERCVYFLPFPHSCDIIKDDMF